MEIDFIPIELVQLWRVLIWAAELSLLGSVAAFFPRAWRARDLDELMPRWTLFTYAAVATALFQAAVGQVFRWHDPMTIQGLPLTTIFVMWCLAARWRRHKDRV